MSLRDDSALRELSSLRGLRGETAVPPLCRETQSLRQHMLSATVGINGLTKITFCAKLKASGVTADESDVTRDKSGVTADKSDVTADSTGVTTEE